MSGGELYCTAHTCQHTYLLFLEDRSFHHGHRLMYGHLAIPVRKVMLLIDQLRQPQELGHVHEVGKKKRHT